MFSCYSTSTYRVVGDFECYICGNSVSTIGGVGGSCSCSSSCCCGSSSSLVVVVVVIIIIVVVIVVVSGSVIVVLVALVVVLKVVVLVLVVGVKSSYSTDYMIRLYVEVSGGYSYCCESYCSIT